jgi:DNA-directed RNA polymerase-4 subunit 1
MERISIVAEATDRVSNKSKGKGSLEGLPQDYWDFVPSENQQLQSTMTKIILSPYQVFHMLKKSDPELIKQFVSRRELLFLSCLPVTPNCHRVVEIGYGLSDGRLTFGLGLFKSPCYNCLMHCTTLRI